jgi:hypothetical protein
MRNVRNFTPADSIKTAGSRNYGDGNFYIHSKERGCNFDDFLNPSLQSSQNASPPFNVSPGISDASPPISSDSGNNSDNDPDDPLALTDTKDPFNYLAHALTASAPSSYHEAKASGEWEHWKPAMDAELAKTDQYKVWEVVDCQPNMRVVGARWVYTQKIGGNTGMPSR